MKYVDHLADRIRRNEKLAPPLDALLRLATLGQRAGMWLRCHRSQTRVPAHVISYGNLTAGGTGKTPAVIERALREQQGGNKVAILTRGYGARRSRSPLVLDPTLPEPADSLARFGDEALLIARSVPGVWIVRCANRVAGARAALQQGCTVLLLDDGFQAVQLARDENYLLIDATNPFGNGFLVPRGILREPVAALNRATGIIVTRCDLAPEALPAIEDVFRDAAPGVPVQFTRHEPTALRRLSDGKHVPLDLLAGADVRVVCGIGNPESFARTLKSLGARVGEMHALPDHAPIPPYLLEGDQLTVVTEKDAVRIGPCLSDAAHALRISLRPYPFTTSRNTPR